MADIAIFVTGPAETNAPSGQYYVACVVRANGNIIAGFETLQTYGDNAAQKQTAIEQRAVTILAEIGVTVGAGDKKTVYGGPNN